ncbi:SURF1 family protein [Cupriavidus basilensis]|uniref:SURF1 family protein n=1 Tax=unclassified Cupriavidus TaxID=2640874 RepID=UPI000450C29D|nr:SURF1 family protein [Cupriavidus sp. SK-3]KDP88667.1 cytochrome C oxidase subunit II [Cupriavidus sp. SK-3]
MKLWRALSPVPTIAALVVIAVTCALGNWQLDRAHEKLARAARLEALAAQPPLVVGSALLEGQVAERRVHVRGRFDAAHTVLLDNRPHGNGTDSRAGFMVLTPLRVVANDPGAPAVLVLRGWLPRDAQDRTRIAPFPTAEGDVELDGTALAAVPRVFSLGQGASAEAGQKIRQNVDLAAFAKELGVPLQPFVLEQRSDNGDGLARDWAPADTGADRHYGYAFQWFGLAALTLVLLVALSWRRAARMAA